MIEKGKIKKSTGALLLAAGIAIGAIGGIKLTDKINKSTFELEEQKSRIETPVNTLENRVICPGSMEGDPIHHICPITREVTEKYGWEIASSHQIEHIKNETDGTVVSSEFFEGTRLSIYGTNTRKINGEYFELIEATPVTNSNYEINYVVPEGYGLIAYDGKWYGAKKAIPEQIVNIPSSIITTYYDKDGNYREVHLRSDGIWQDVSPEMSQEEGQKLTK